MLSPGQKVFFPFMCQGCPREPDLMYGIHGANSLIESRYKRQ
jgi:hypothetical protein